mmetsp:Transcript_57340/g.92765  ORF Transcript_57340/g.92765 Transcript_57340/m.92765 type:complete len:205 (-) Transcript_57340:42-656(-)|eukprot:CAMPEP_0179420604 /NCGR_PEP_ID=MMETSP0799-20121207/9265_1 /TAXON_ID=46947 /ORGANISM="Geminigera cryophila, Strain CCMP2564" /LENGTH=204 /DNA_ID=CAMNT_0021194243 /DNA_START=481 /DNA_END=1095 /DNA_ORIENTATION=+
MNGLNAGKFRGRKRPCERGQACPWQNEHQHTAEFSHDGPSKKNEANGNGKSNGKERVDAWEGKGKGAVLGSEKKSIGGHILGGAGGAGGVGGAWSIKASPSEGRKKRKAPSADRRELALAAAMQRAVHEPAGRGEIPKTLVPKMQTFSNAKDSTPLKFRHGGDGLNLRKSDQSDPKSNAIGSKSDVNSNGRRAVKAKVIDLTDD